MLDRLFESAFRAGKRARAETSIGAGVVSIASAACELARQGLRSLDALRVVVVGAGETSRLAAKHLAQHCPGGVTIVNRTFARAEALASELGIAARAVRAARRGNRAADLVVTATTAPTAILSSATVRDAMATRANRPLLIIDLAVPRDVEPEVASVAQRHPSLDRCDPDRGRPDACDARRRGAARRGDRGRGSREVRGVAARLRGVAHRSRPARPLRARAQRRDRSPARQRQRRGARPRRAADEGAGQSPAAPADGSLEGRRSRLGRGRVAPARRRASCSRSTAGEPIMAPEGALLRVGTRASRLALWQTDHVVSELRRHWPALRSSACRSRRSATA